MLCAQNAAASDPSQIEDGAFGQISLVRDTFRNTVHNTVHNNSDSQKTYPQERVTPMLENTHRDLDKNVW